MSSRSGQAARRRQQTGFNLVELMVALLIGLLVSAAAITVFLSNRQAYAATEGVGRLQESARVAFEMMSRDLRESGGNPCDVALPTANVLSTAEAAAWYGNWAQPLVGFANGSLTGSLAGTDAVQVLSAGDNLSTVSLHVPALITNAFTTTGTPTVAAGDFAMVCDTQQLAIVKVGVVALNVVTTLLADNRCNNLGTKPSVCALTSGYTFQRNAVMAPMSSKRWYVATNARGGTSLFQSVRRGNTVGTEEIVDGVSAMTITYLVNTGTDYVSASAITDWSVVTAARITLTVTAPGTRGTDNAVLNRTLVHTVNLRNRTLQS